MTQNDGFRTRMRSGNNEQINSITMVDIHKDSNDYFIIELHYLLL